VAAYRAKHSHIFPRPQLFPKLCAVEVDDLRCPLCTFRVGAIYQHRENVFIIFHVAILRRYNATCRIQAAATFLRFRLPSALPGAGQHDRMAAEEIWPTTKINLNVTATNGTKPCKGSWQRANDCLVDNHAAAALAQLSESGTLLGWIVPIENKYELPGVESGHGRH
jgi:hypothetical protein